MVVLKIHHLSKTFRSGFIPRPVKAIDDVSFEVDQGEIFGLLGPTAQENTTIKCILNLVYPDSGTIELLAKRPASSREPDSDSSPKALLYDFLTRGVPGLFREALRMSSADARRKTDELLAFFHMEDTADASCESTRKACSSGSDSRRR